MIRINLLPHRELKREAQKKQFNALLGASAIAGVLCLFFANSLIQEQADNQLYRNQRLDQEIAKLDKEIEDIKDLKQQIRLMLERKQVVEDLQTNRHQAVVIMDEISRQLPDGMYFKKITQKGKTITLEGVSDTNARVATMVRNLDRSYWLTNPKLVEIKAVTNEHARQHAFKLDIDLKPKGLDMSEGIAQQHPTLH